MYWVLGSLVIPMVRVLQVMQRVLSSLLMPTVRVLPMMLRVMSLVRVV